MADAMIAAAVRAARLVALRDLLQERWWAAGELAVHFGVHPRTIERDLALAQDQDQPLRWPLVRMCGRWRWASRT